MNDFTIAITLDMKYGDLCVLLELLRNVKARKMVISNRYQLPSIEELRVDYAENIPDNPGHQKGVFYLMRAIGRVIPLIEQTRWIIHIHSDTFLLDFNKIVDITAIMETNNKKISGFRWYGPNTLSTDFFIVDMKWADEIKLFDFCLESGHGAEGELFWRAVHNDYSNYHDVLFLPYDVTKDKQETRARSEGGARNFPWRDQFSIMHDHLGEYDHKMKEFPSWSKEVENMLVKYRNYSIPD